MTTLPDFRPPADVGSPPYAVAVLAAGWRWYSDHRDGDVLRLELQALADANPEQTADRLLNAVLYLWLCALEYNRQEYGLEVDGFLQDLIANLWREAAAPGMGA